MKFAFLAITITLLLGQFALAADTTTSSSKEQTQLRIGIKKKGDCSVKARVGYLSLHNHDANNNNTL